MKKTSKVNTSEKPVRFVVKMSDSSIDVDGDRFRVDENSGQLSIYKGTREVFRAGGHMWYYCRAVFNRE
jgi:hypothetical protein